MFEKYLEEKCSVTDTMCKFYLCTKWTTPLTTVKSFILNRQSQIRNDKDWSAYLQGGHLYLKSLKGPWNWKEMPPKIFELAKCPKIFKKYSRKFLLCDFFFNFLKFSHIKSIFYFRHLFSFLYLSSQISLLQTILVSKVSGLNNQYSV